MPVAIHIAFLLVLQYIVIFRHVLSCNIYLQHVHAVFQDALLHDIGTIAQGTLYCTMFIIAKRCLC